MAKNFVPGGQSALRFEKAAREHLDHQSDSLGSPAGAQRLWITSKERIRCCVTKVLIQNRKKIDSGDGAKFEVRPPRFVTKNFPQTT